MKRDESAASPAPLSPAARREAAFVRFGYPIALGAHALLGPLFFLLDVVPLALFNIGSVAAWVTAIWAYRRGRLGLARALPTIEVAAHAALAVALVGWGPGFQNYLLFLACVVFFIRWPLYVQATVVALYAAEYVVLYTLYAAAPPPFALPAVVVNVLFSGNAVLVFAVLALTLFITSSATDKAEAVLAAEKARSDEMAALLKTMFGRYLSQEVMSSLLENPSALQLGGERRPVTIMMTDLRGFTALAERLPPERVVQLLNAYFEVMVEIVLEHRGTINEFIGDALLVVFGAPQEMPDRAQRAVACAIRMQNAMARVNEDNRAQGLPELEMGIGLNEADVVVGNIGSSKRSKYAIVGSGVNMASRIESYTVGGQVLVSESVRAAAADVLRIDAQRDVFPKGAATPLRIYEVGGIAGEHNVALERAPDDLVTLQRPLRVRCQVVHGKDVDDHAVVVQVQRLSRTAAQMELDRDIPLLGNLKLSLEGVPERLAALAFYGKTVARDDDDGALRAPFTVRFTSVPPEVDAYLEACRQHAA